MNSLLLWLIGLLAPVWRGLGADPRAVKLIVATKLRVSDRTSTKTLSGTKKKKTGKWAEALSYLMLLFIGGILVLFMIRIDHLPTALGAGYVILAVYLAMLLILELSESIFDTRDVTVLLSRPITDMTFALARGLFVFTYSVKMMLVMTIIPFGYLAMTSPLELPIFLVATTALTVMSTVTVLIFYQYLLRKLSANRFKKLLGTIQIAFSGFFISLYLAPQLIGNIDENAAGLRIVGEVYGFAFPSFWVAAWHDLGAEATALSYVQAGLGVFAFIAAVYLYRTQAGGYGASLMQLRGSGSAEEPGRDAEAAPPGADTALTATPLGDRLAGLFTRPGLERASFRYHWAMMLRDRSFKAKVYPALVLVPLFIIFFILKDSSGDAPEATSSNLLLGLYYMTMTVISPLAQARLTATPGAGWLWAVHPLPRRGAVVYGQYMASLSQFYLPTFLLALPLFIYQAGPGFLPDILLAMGVSIVAGAIYQYLEKNPPFSTAADGKRMGNIGAMIGVLLFAGVAGAAHYFLSMAPYGVWIGLAVAWAAAVGSLWGLRRVTGSYN